MNLLVFGAEEQLSKRGNQLLKLGKVIDWERFRKHLRGFYKSEERDLGGKRPYDVLKMFKAILLGQWHSLSDPALEESLSVRLDFMLFTGFEIGEELPDETTLCRFRNRLFEKGRHKSLFRELNRQLKDLGIKVKDCEGAVIDATIITSASRPKRTLEVDEEGEVCDLKESEDPDASWVKKGSKSHFGYRAYIRTDAKDGFIEAVEVRPANESEMNMLESIVHDSNSQRIYADKGYASKKNRLYLRENGFKDGIMERTYKGNILSHWQKLKNKLISSKRFIVERTFGTMKRQLHCGRARYRERWRVEGEFCFKALSYNLLKAARVVHAV